MGPEGLSLYLQKLSIRLYLETIKFSPCLHGAWGSVVVKALRYWLDGPGIDSRCCHWIFQ